MRTIRDLQQYFGMTARQIHLRLDALSTLLDGHLHRGKSNAILLDDHGFALFRRLVELERDQGLSCQAAVELMKEELSSSPEDAHANRSSADGKPGETGVKPGETVGIEGYREAIEVLKKQNEFLQRQVERLLEQLREKDEQLQAMLPASVERSRKRWWQFWK